MKNGNISINKIKLNKKRVSKSKKTKRKVLIQSSSNIKENFYLVKNK